MSQLVAVATRGAATVSPTHLDRVAGRVLDRPAAVSAVQHGRVTVAHLHPSGLDTIGGPTAGDALADRLDHLGDASWSIRPDGVTITNGQLRWRTLWWADTDELTVVSTSLRIMAYLLGGLEPDPAALNTFLLLGSLGPDQSWDRRVRQLPAGAALSLSANDGSASLTTSTAPLLDVQAPGPQRSDEEARRHLEATLRERLGQAMPTAPGWVLPLSGGVDSRGLLLLGPRALPTVTWGARASLADQRTDSAVAARLAAAAGVEVDHRFFDLDAGDADPDTVLSRFVSASEGRTDHIGSYTDGMRLWQGLADEGTVGIVRGDEAFGWIHRTSEAAVRRSVGYGTCDEFAASSVVDALCAGGLDGDYPRLDGETLAAYRDRLYRTFRISSVLAALTTVKSAYVDVACPYLDPVVVAEAAMLSDDQRTDKRIFRSIVEAASPPVPFATRSGRAPAPWVEQPAVREALRRSIDGLDLTPLPEPVRAAVTAPVTSTASPGSRGARGALRSLARHLVPESMAQTVARRVPEGPQRVTRDQLQLRVALALGARDLLIADASAGAAAL